MKAIEAANVQNATQARESHLLSPLQHAAGSLLDLLSAVRNPLAYALLGTTSGPQAQQLADIYVTRDTNLWIEAARRVQSRVRN